MKKASIFIMVISAIATIVFTIALYHSVTDNVVDSNGFWAYMYGPVSVPWPVFSSVVIFLMGLTCFFATTEQKSERFE